MSAAEFTYDTMVPDGHFGLYNSHDENATNAAWEALSYDAGAVALTQEYIDLKRLPPAQPFPWDDNKHIYFVNGYHGLHCLVSPLSAMFDSR